MPNAFLFLKDERSHFESALFQDSITIIMQLSFNIVFIRTHQRKKPTTYCLLFSVNKTSHREADIFFKQGINELMNCTKRWVYMRKETKVFLSRMKCKVNSPIKRQGTKFTVADICIALEHTQTCHLVVRQSKGRVTILLFVLLIHLIALHNQQIHEQFLFYNQVTYMVWNVLW